MLFGAVGQHRPDFSVSANGPLEDDVSPIRRPGRKVVAAGFVGDLQPLLAGNIHHVDVLAAGSAVPLTSGTP